MHRSTTAGPIVILLLGLVCDGVAAETLEGFYARGAGAGEFAPCGEAQVVRIRAGAAVLQRLDDGYARLASVPHEPVYAWLEGNRRRDAGAAHEDVFEVSRVRLMRRRSRDDCLVPARLDGSGLHYLYALVERTPAETGLFDSLPLRGRLERLLGDALPVFLAGMQVQGPLRRVGDLVYVQGTGSGPGQAAVLLAAPEAGRLVAIVVSGGEAREYAEEDEPIPLPQSVRRFLEGAVARP